MSRQSASIRLALAPLVAALLLAGCAVGPDYIRPAVAQPATKTNCAATADAQQAVAADWWTLYNDATLTSLVTTALQDNSDLQLAIARSEEAQAVLDETGSALLPEIDLYAASTRSRSSTFNAQRLPAGTPVISNSNRLALSTTFELDFWGKLRRATESARAQVLGSRYGRAVTAHTLAGPVARSEFAQRSLDAQIAVSRETLASRADSLAVISSRAKGGLATQLEVNQAE